MEKFRVGDHYCERRKKEKKEKTSATRLGFGGGGVCSLRGTSSNGRAYDFDCAVPGAGDECVLGHGVPADGKRLALVFVKVHDGKVVDTEVKELERAIATCDNELVLVDLGPGEIVEGVIGIKATHTAFVLEKRR